MSTFKKTYGRLLLLLLASLLVFSCATYREYTMRGSIVKSTGDDVYVCIGTKDGAASGQEFNVYKIVHDPRSWTDLAKEYTGKVTITEAQEHFSKAKVVSGTADVNSVVERTHRWQ